MSKLVRIKEYEYIFCESPRYKIDNEKVISKKAFEELTQLIADSSEQDGNDHGTIFWQRGQKLQARHYVGVIQTSDGTQVEILPKIADSYKDEELQRILLKMLRTVGDLPYKSGQTASLQNAKFPLLEIFIRDFLECVDFLVKRGIRSDYVRQEDNLAFLKGKMLMSEQIKHNLVRQDRFFVEYDSFEVNRPENRLIKSSLQKILRITKHLRNQRLARELLFVFDEAPFSDEPKQDLKKCSKDRGMHYYKASLEWCKLILNDESPVPTVGQKTFRSFLFPMPQIFERYVAKKMSKALPEWKLSTQVSNKKLLSSQEWNTDLFVIKPDILLEKKQCKVIADTKWKLPDENDKANKFNIHQGDLYQLFTYAKFYEARTVILIYPKTDNFEKTLHCEYVNQTCNVIFMSFDLKQDQFDLSIFSRTQ